MTRPTSWNSTFSTAPRIAYVCSRYPALREVFIIREVLALERAGVEVEVYSLKRPETGLEHAVLRETRAAPYYSPHLLSAALVLDNLATLLGSPLAYLRFPLTLAWRLRRHAGLALKTEFLGLAVMAEIPLVIVLVQRGGPSTGLPTKIEQGDLLASLFGALGDAPKILIAPATVGGESIRPPATNDHFLVPICASRACTVWRSFSAKMQRPRATTRPVSSS